MKIFVLIHNYNNGFQAETFKTMQEAEAFERDLIDEYEIEEKRKFADRFELNEYINEVDIVIVETELK